MSPDGATLPRPLAWRTALLLTFVLWFAYLANFRFISTGDTTAVRYLPFSILMRGSLNVDGYVEPYFKPFLDGTFNYGIYFASQSRGHWMSNYPVLTPVVVTPLYLPAALWLAHRHVAPAAEAMKFWAGAMEKLSAALLAALAVTILYGALRRVLAERPALLLALVYAFASLHWSTSAQALWLHGMTELSLALLLWALVADRGDQRSAAWIGLALALAVANKLTNGVVALPIIVWFVGRSFRQPQVEPAARRLLAFFAPQVVLGLMVLAYNLHYFGSPLGAYETAFRTLGYGGISGGFHGNLAEAIAGNLVSPSRGLFFFVPWTLFSLWGAARAWRQWSWAPWLLGGALLHFLIYAKLERWWAGWSYGPRYLTDLMPLLVFFLVPLWTDLTRRRWLKPALLVAFALALGVQLIGVYCYPNGDWNSKPTNIDYQPSRVWDWRDPQILRTLRAGPAPTRFGERLRDLELTR